MFLLHPHLVRTSHPTTLCLFRGIYFTTYCIFFYFFLFIYKLFIINLTLLHATNKNTLKLSDVGLFQYFRVIILIIYFFKYFTINKWKAIFHFQYHTNADGKTKRGKIMVKYLMYGSNMKIKTMKTTIAWKTVKSCCNTWLVYICCNNNNKVGGEWALSRLLCVAAAGTLYVTLLML